MVPSAQKVTERPNMNACARLGPVDLSALEPAAKSGGEIEHGVFSVDADSLKDSPGIHQITKKKIQVYLVADNQLLRETLARILTKRGSVDVTGLDSPWACEAGSLARAGAEVVLLVSQGNIREDLATVQRMRLEAPHVRILLIGSTNKEGEFLQCVRAGISGYLWRDASADDVLAGIRAVHAGEAVCPGALCTVLFHYFERETPELPCASPRQRLGLTRREQQLVPLIAKGFTNKEIANHFCLSEQTVKNHLYRMKHKIGAEDRLSIVQRFRTQGFLL
jgi:DNA-binding NarL/FixJ family response regulator